MLRRRDGFCLCSANWPVVLALAVLILRPRGASGLTGWQPPVPANLTIRHSTPYTVCLTWTLGAPLPGSAPLALQVIYRPINASYRVIADVRGHQRSVTLDNLRPETQYRLVMTSSSNGSPIGTSPVIFFHTPPTLPLGILRSPHGEHTDVLSAEEISIIIIVLGVWMLAIVLFFNRWGKIRMLEPYEYNFKYHHPLPELGHRQSCPLADGAPLLPSSLDRRFLPYGRRCSSLSAYVVTEPRMARNNSEPVPPQRYEPAAHRASMQELRPRPAPAPELALPLDHLGPPQDPAPGRRQMSEHGPRSGRGCLCREKTRDSQV
ncbi:uncharacterized protein LOC119105378 [Pollicipes pollicipes]|uniref:uncharacterized protein LOC119105378 n=1 Tax=Pollicipes pollicipes TaxID=41117 RepID=UPI0018856D01|nr:uncharacterized protein LOC119105378 [Pollicipes pollicipes]